MADLIVTLSQLCGLSTQLFGFFFARLGSQPPTVYEFRQTIIWFSRWFREYDKKNVIKTSENYILFIPESMGVSPGLLVHPLPGTQRKEIRELEKADRKIAKSEWRLLFNGVCLSENLPPYYAYLVVQQGSFSRLFHRCNPSIRHISMLKKYKFHPYTGIRHSNRSSSLEMRSKLQMSTILFF